MVIDVDSEIIVVKDTIDLPCIAFPIHQVVQADVAMENLCILKEPSITLCSIESAMSSKKHNETYI